MPVAPLDLTPALPAARTLTVAELAEVVDPATEVKRS